MSKRALPDNETKVLEKGWDFSAILRKINEPELRLDFGKSAIVWELSSIFIMNWPFSETHTFYTSHLRTLLNEIHGFSYYNRGRNFYYYWKASQTFQFISGSMDCNKISSRS